MRNPSIKALCDSLHTDDSVLIELRCGSGATYSVLVAPVESMVRREVAHARRRKTSGEALVISAIETSTREGDTE